MAKNADRQQAIQQLVAWFLRQSWPVKLVVLALVVVGLTVAYFSYDPTRTQPNPDPGPGSTGTTPGTTTLDDGPAPELGTPSPELLRRREYLFCWWNLENFFDDKVDGWKTDADEEYDQWFGNSPDMVRLKLKNLTTALLKLNGGIGPDILACCEVEDTPDAKVTPRALVLLRDTLNRGISDPGLRYREILWKRMAGGRNIINAILTRLPVDPRQTKLVYRNERILQGVIQVRGQELVVIASHWTSRLTDKTGERRAAYGDAIYRHVKTLYGIDPNMAVIVAGDFNDPPEEPSVTQHLWATTDRAEVLNSGREPYLYNLMRQPHLAGQGTIDGRAGGLDMFDQLVVTPGMIRPRSPSWTVDPESLRIVTEGTTHTVRGSEKLRPLRFGSRNEKGLRGCSDHLPVVVTLRLE